MTCPEVPLTGRAVAVGEIVCQAQRFSAGDGTANDLWLANARLRAVGRHPQASLTLAGVGGGTLVDLAPWGSADGLLELSPLVDDGWLLVDESTLTEDAWTVGGIVRALPDRPDTPEGARREITWRVTPEVPWIELEGADGLWLHVGQEATRLGDWLLVGDTVYGHDGVLDEDLGGALRLKDVHRVLAAPLDEAWRAGLRPTQEVSGRAPGAATILASGPDGPLAVLRVDDEGRFAGPVPSAVLTLQARAPGHAPSARLPVGEDVDLSLGARGSVQLNVGWEPPLRPRPLFVRWTAEDGREGDARILPQGDTLELGEGLIHLSIEAGHAAIPQSVDLALAADEEVDLEVRMRPRLDAGSWVAADLAWPSGRSRTVRASMPGQLRSAVAGGYAFVIATSEDDAAPSFSYLNDAPWIRWTDGATLHHPAGWSITTWPMNGAAREAGGGVPRIVDLDPEDALRAAKGGARNRTVRVPLAWIEDADRDPRVLTPVPDFVVLPSPRGDLETWKPGADLIDLGRFVRPSGPMHWLDIVDADHFTAVELDRALQRGMLSAGTGAWIDLRVGDAGPGGVLSPGQETPDVVVRVQRGDRDLDRVGLIGPGAELVDQITLDEDDLLWEPTVPLPAWVAAVAWSTRSEDWSVTMPVWRTPPFLPAEPPADTAPPEMP